MNDDAAREEGHGSAIRGWTLERGPCAERYGGEAGRERPGAEVLREDRGALGETSPAALLRRAPDAGPADEMDQNGKHPCVPAGPERNRLPKLDGGERRGEADARQRAIADPIAR